MKLLVELLEDSRMVDVWMLRIVSVATSARAPDNSIHPGHLDYSGPQSTTTSMFHPCAWEQFLRILIDTSLFNAFMGWWTGHNMHFEYSYDRYRDDF